MVILSPPLQVAETAEGEGESSQFAEMKAIHLALDIADQEKWLVFYLCPGSWMLANALWEWYRNRSRVTGSTELNSSELWQNIAAWVKNLVVKVPHVDAHVPKSRATEEHQNNQQVNQVAKTEVAQVALDWQYE